MTGPPDVIQWPAIAFSQGHLEVTHGRDELRRCTRAGIRRGWFDDLVIVDTTGHAWQVRLIGARPDGFVGWLTGRMVADLDVAAPRGRPLEGIRQHVLDTLDGHPELWDADGQLQVRRRAISSATDVASIIGALETSAA